MIGLLQKIVDYFVCWVQTGIVLALNFVIAGLGTLVQTLVDLMPVEMPDVPTLPGPFTTALAWVAWVFPVGTVITIFAFLVTAWVAWFALSLVLRWAKAVQ